MKTKFLDGEIVLMTLGNHKCIPFGSIVTIIHWVEEHEGYCVDFEGQHYFIPEMWLVKMQHEK